MTIPRYCTLCGGELVPMTFVDKYGNVWEMFECPDDGWLEPAAVTELPEEDEEPSE